MIVTQSYSTVYQIFTSLLSTFNYYCSSFLNLCLLLTCPFIIMSVPSLEEVEIDEELYMTIKMVSTLKKARQISTDVIFIYNLPCRFIAKLTRKNNKKYLGVFVTCNEGSDDESTVCRCWLEFFVLHRKDSSKHYTKRKGCLFKKDARIHGFEDFLAWEEVIRPENEYIVKNEIRLRVNIEMVKPRTYSYFSEELSTGYCDLSNSLLTPKRSEVLFRFRIDNIMKTVREFSPTFYVQNMPWKIMAVLHESKTENEKDTEKKLGVFLRCYGLKGIESWACYAHVTIYIWNHNLNKEPFRRIFSHLYHRDAADYGIYSLLSNERLTNENLGYVNKGSLVIEVEIDTEKPIIIHKRQPVEGPFMINNFVIPDILAHLYTLEDH